MAARTTRARKAAESTDTAPQAASVPSLNLVRSEGVKKAKRGMVVPEEVTQAVYATLGEGPLAFSQLSTEDEARQVERWVRKVAREAEPTSLSLSCSVTQADDGTWTVDFQASTEKRQHKYTADDVRAWVAEQNGEESFTGKLTKEIRAAYRAAHGYPVKTDSSED